MTQLTWCPHRGIDAGDKRQGSTKVAHKERMHLDLESDDVEAEVRRLEALGAARYDHQ